MPRSAMRSRRRAPSCSWMTRSVSRKVMPRVLASRTPRVLFAHPGHADENDVVHGDAPCLSIWSPSEYTTGGLKREGGNCRCPPTRAGRPLRSLPGRPGRAPRPAATGPRGGAQQIGVGHRLGLLEHLFLRGSGDSASSRSRKMACSKYFWSGARTTTTRRVTPFTMVTTPFRFPQYGRKGRGLYQAGPYPSRSGWYTWVWRWRR